MQTLLCSAYLPPITFFTAICNGGDVVFEQYDNYRKQTYRNRCAIATSNGRQILTIPVEKTESPKQLMKDVRISDHGDWRHLHWNALESAYMNSPFFIYYQDDFRPIYEKKFNFLLDFNIELTKVMIDLIGIKTNISLSDSYEQTVKDTIDFRNLIEPDYTISDGIQPYYQVFKQKNGFIGNLSIIDLLSNMGPESLLILRNGANKLL
jgi:hypothetical protein